MTKFAFALLITAFVSTSAMAQSTVVTPVGNVVSVEGVGTVSQGNTLGNLVKDQRIFDGANIVTTASGTVVVRLPSGCLVSLAPNQSVKIDSKLDCPTQVSRIQNIGATPGSQAGAGSAAGGGGGALGLGALGVGALGAYSNQRGSGS